MTIVADESYEGGRTIRIALTLTLTCTRCGKVGSFTVITYHEDMEQGRDLAIALAYQDARNSDWTELRNTARTCCRACTAR